MADIIPVKAIRTGADVTALGEMVVADTISGSIISNTPVGNIVATTVQSAINELDTEKVATALLGAANGVATLDAGAKIPVSQMPAAVVGAMNYQGAWNAATNTPALVSSVGTKGFYYVVSVPGNTNLNGNAVWSLNDTVVFNGAAWDIIQGGITSAEVIAALGFTPANIASPSFTGIVANSNSIAVTAAGTDQGTATALTSQFNRVTAATANQGVRLPASVNGQQIGIDNDTAVTILLYPPTGGVLDNLAANAPITLYAGVSTILVGNGSGYDSYVEANPVQGVTSVQTLTVGGNITITGANALRGSYGGGGVTSNFAAGDGALLSNTTGYHNTACGVTALQANTTGLNNTASGMNALYYNTTGYQNAASGAYALYYNTTGIKSTACGVNALLSNTTGSNNTACGVTALQNNTTGSGNTAINPLNSAGAYAPVFNPTVENNRLCMGSTGVTNAYVQVAWTVVSDARDKTDFAPVPHGLDFVSKLQPTAYRYKMNRSDVEGHGTVRYGFKAQDVLALEGDTPVIVDAEDPDKLRFNDQAMIAVLVNALQELNAKFDQYVSTHP